MKSPKWRAFRYHLFLLLALLGALAPWFTPREFPVHRIPFDLRMESALRTVDSLQSPPVELAGSAVDTVPPDPCVSSQEGT